MSYEDGWAAINLQMPGRVPHAEFDAERHWELVKKVTGLPVGVASPHAEQFAASKAFMCEWNYDLTLGACVFGDIFGNMHTSMGHAEYAAGGVDFNNNIGSPFKNVEEVLNFDPWEVYGERNQQEITTKFNEHYRSTREDFPSMVSTTGIYVTCVSGMIDIFGWDMLLEAAGEDSRRFGEMLERYGSWMLQYYQALAESEAPIIYSHDDIVWTAGAFIHPEWYRRYVFPTLKKYYQPLRDCGKKIIFLSDGNYTEFIDDIADTGVHGFFFEPLTDLRALVERYGQTHVLIGNVDTRILLFGTREEIRTEVTRCIELGKNCPGYFIGVTNMIPPNTPIENALYYYQVYEELSRR